MGWTQSTSFGEKPVPRLEKAFTIMHSRFERCTEENDPKRCQGTSQSYGQCPFKAIEGTRHCPRHGGLRTERKNEQESQRLYILTAWQERFGRHAEHSKIKSLRDDLAILRMTLENRLNECRDSQQLMMASGAVTEMVREIAKTAKTCHQLEVSMNVVLDKTQAEAWVQELGSIIATYVEDPQMLQMIAEDMVASLQKRMESNPLIKIPRID